MEWIFNRRFFRIYPAYLLAIGIFFLRWPWGTFQLNSITRIEQLATHILAVHNFDVRYYNGINPSFWSIAVEIQLYALYPLLISLAARVGWRKALMMAGFIEIAIRVAVALQSTLSDGHIPLFVSASPFAFWLSWSMGHI